MAFTIIERHETKAELDEALNEVEANPNVMAHFIHPVLNPVNGEIAQFILIISISGSPA